MSTVEDVNINFDINYQDLENAIRNLNQADRSLSRFYANEMRLGNLNLSQIPQQYRDILQSIIRADNGVEDLNDDMEQTNNVSGSFASNFASRMQQVGQSLQTAGETIKNIGRGLIDNVTKPLSDLIVFGVKYNSTMQDLETSFKVMLGSQDKAKKMSKDLVEMGAKTPFESSQLAEYTKMLLSFGYTQKNVLPIMGRLGDISLGNNEKMSSLTRTMGQINSLGKLQGGDLNQLIGQGWNPLLAITKKSGESMEQVRKRMSEGKVSYKEVEQALVDATSKGGQFYKGMDEGSKTFSGQLSTLKDNFAIFAGELTKPIFDGLMKILPKIIEIVSNLSNKFKSMSAPVKTVLLILAGLAMIIGPIVLVFGTLVTIAGAVIGAISAIGAAIATIGLPILAGIVAVIAGIGIMIGVFVAAGVAIFTFIKSSKETQKILMDIAGIVKGVFVSAINKAKSLWATWGGDIKRVAKEGFKYLESIVVPILLNLKDTIVFFINNVKPAWAHFSTEIKKLAPTFLDIYNNSKPLLQTLGEGLKVAAGIAMKMIKGIIVAFRLLAPVITTAITTAIKIFSAFVSHVRLIVTGVKVALNLLKPVVTTVFAIIKNTIMTALNIIKNIIKVATSLISGDWKKAWTSVKVIFSTAWNGIKNNVRIALDGVKSIIRDRINMAKDIVKSGLDAIKRFFSGLKLSFPKIKLPHFKMSGSFDISKMKVPSIGVNWYASGTKYASGGLAMVGEKGPELVNLSRGSQVYTNAQTRGMVNNTSRNNSVVMNIYGSNNVEELSNQIVRRLRTAGVY